MNKKVLIKGNEAIVKAAILAGCKAYYGYPITPASEIAETAAKDFPKAEGVFLQAESEVAAINMVYGAAATGQRVMTASSGPGISLKAEGISYCAGSELPVVIASIMRGGPGLGNIGPEQSDYNQIVKGGGHGNYKCIVLAPNCAQEMCDFTIKAFDLADKYRIPAFIVADGAIGQMKEPVEFPEPIKIIPEKKWAAKGTKESNDNLICSIFLDHEDLEKHNIKLQEKYKEIEKNEVEFEEYHTDDAEIICIGYGIVSRIIYSCIDLARKKGLKVGLIRPKTLWPFPSQRLSELAKNVKSFFTVELSNGQMVDDVKLALNGSKPVHFYNRMGGMIPTPEELLEQIEKIK